MKYLEKDFKIEYRGEKNAKWPKGKYVVAIDPDGVVVGIYGNRGQAVRAIPNICKRLNGTTIVKGLSTVNTVVNNKVDSK